MGKQIINPATAATGSMMEENMFVPIWEKDGNELFVCTEDFTGQTETEAMKIGWGASLVEGVLWKINFTKKVVEIDPKNTPHRKAQIHDTPVAIISGPLFEATEI